MTTDAVEVRLLGLVSEIIRRPEGAMQPTATWSELGIDSLDFLSVLTECEAVFDCVIPDARAIVLTSPRALASYVCSNAAASAAIA